MDKKWSQKDFESFYHRHIDKVYRFIFFRVGGNTNTTEDLVSEIFIKALDHFANYDEEKSRSAWIMTIARNHLFNYWRDTKKTQALPEDKEEDERGDNFWFAQARMAWQNDGEKLELQELLAQLTPEEQEIVTFHYIAGYSYAEIAEFKGTTEGAVKVATHRAIKKLRTLL
ncbi:MAG TPA: RNA polymerase sigma factor [Patescibacteria group bacterium]|nr:RNA polymerase sigma factor [Patescibacteria group bacterium]